MGINGPPTPNSRPESGLPQPRNTRRDRGFTLLEIMLVVVLIGVAAGYIVLNLDRDEDQVALLEAKRFASLLNHIRDESVLIGRPLAVEVDDFDGVYRFLHLEKGKWAIEASDTVLRERRFPEFLDVEFKLLQGVRKGGKKQGDKESKTGKDDKKGEKRQLLIADPGGTLTPFLLSVSGEDESFKVTVDNTQKVIVGQDEEPR